MDCIPFGVHLLIPYLIFLICGSCKIDACFDFPSRLSPKVCAAAAAAGQQQGLPHPGNLFVLWFVVSSSCFCQLCSSCGTTALKSFMIVLFLKSLYAIEPFFCTSRESLPFAYRVTVPICYAGACKYGLMFIKRN
jgi:hypothetical protein